MQQYSQAQSGYYQCRNYYSGAVFTAYNLNIKFGYNICEHTGSCALYTIMSEKYNFEKRLVGVQYAVFGICELHVQKVLDKLNKCIIFGDNFCKKSESQWYWLQTVIIGHNIIWFCLSSATRFATLGGTMNMTLVVCVSNSREHQVALWCYAAASGPHCRFHKYNASEM